MKNDGTKGSLSLHAAEKCHFIFNAQIGAMVSPCGIVETIAYTKLSVKIFRKLREMYDSIFQMDLQIQPRLRVYTHVTSLLRALLFIIQRGA